jgi:acylphosphatase
MKHVDLKIIGKVQGVFFRVRAKEKADDLGLTGAIWNASDGSVQAEIEGEESKIEEFIAWCKGGSYEVEQVESEEGSVKELEGFEIRL